MSSVTKRVLTGVVGILFLSIVFFLGIKAVKIAIFILTLEIIRELYNAFYNINIKLNLKVLFLSAIFTFIISMLNINVIYAFIISFLINGFLTIIIDDYSLEESIYTFFSYSYGIFLITLLGTVNEIYLIISTFVIAFSTDTFAYIVGMLIGKTKLIPRISPNKSVEGAIGGTLFCLIITFIYFYFINKYYVRINLNATVAILIIIASVAGQFGDLFASKIKRRVEIKDYANLLPGHGGILDRFDSILFVSPLIYVLFYFIS